MAAATVPTLNGTALIVLPPRWTRSPGRRVIGPSAVSGPALKANAARALTSAVRDRTLCGFLGLWVWGLWVWSLGGLGVLFLRTWTFMVWGLCVVRRVRMYRYGTAWFG